MNIITRFFYFFLIPIILVFSREGNVCAQEDTLKLINYSFLYPGKYNFQYFLNASNESKKITEDTSASWSEKEFYYWRSLNSHMSLLAPDSVIKQIWNEAFENSPIGICDFYSYIFSQPFNREYFMNTPVSYFYMHNEKSYFDSMCQPLYQAYDSVLMRTMWKLVQDDNGNKNRVIDAEQTKRDIANQVRVDSILTKLGKYPGRTLVSWSLEHAAWIVIQHAPLEYQQKYFPLIAEAVQNKDLAPKYLAYSVDRINMAQGLPQVYGTQFKDEGGTRILYKLEDLDTVDQKRKSVGLPTLKSYMDESKITFDEE